MANPDPLQLFDSLKTKSLPPVDSWNPPLSGEMNMLIKRDGSWYHEGDPIHRRALVKLFASILRREQDGHYYLLTPAEKWRIKVEDAPFLAVELRIESEGENQQLHFRTNLDDVLSANANQPIRVAYHKENDEPSPYVRVRGGLDALISRSVFLELVELGVEIENGTAIGVWSGGECFELGKL